jgi:HD-GYP domain-containing protein (c-di-GMP phosphodiesterase class II)
MLAGESFVGPTEEVRTLDALRASLDGKGAALVLADVARLEAEGEEVKAWLEDGGDAQVVVVAVADREDGDAVLETHPFVDDVIARPVSPGRLKHKLERALEAIHNRRIIRQLERKVTRKGQELEELNKIGVALSAERNIDKLLERILTKSRDITGADAGSLYIVERDKVNGEEQAERLRFKLAQNDSMPVDFEERLIPLDDSSIAGYAAGHGELINVPDAYTYDPRPDSPFRASQAFDEELGYRTKSMLVVPMRDHQNEVIGIVQLINKKRDPTAVLQPVETVEEEVSSFTSIDEKLAGSLASQAAVAYRNAALLKNIQDLFGNFVKAAAYAIEQRDETTKGHSERVAILCVGLARHVDAVPRGPLAGVSLTADQMRELEYAALLHDFGKVGVREKVLLKERKLLHGQLSAIQHRFAYVRQCLENQRLRARFDRTLKGETNHEALDLEFDRRQREIDAVLQAVERANEPTVLPDEESFEALRHLRGRTFPTLRAEQLCTLEEWARVALAERPEERLLLSTTELATLAVPKGSLTPKEYGQIKSHVEKTFEFLSKIDWTGEFRRIPEIARAHHEKLDGTGYPLKLSGKDNIPVQSRMMTIADVYDALVAQDRPYKKAQPVERALDILSVEMRGQLDEELLAVFIKARVWDDPEFKKRIERTRRR